MFLKIAETLLRDYSFPVNKFSYLLTAREGSLVLQNYYHNYLNDIKKSEFKVFSQWNDDGIIQFLINYLNIEQKTFIEFGVENYLESNTRFLLINNNWKGLIIASNIT